MLVYIFIIIIIIWWSRLLFHLWGKYNLLFLCLPGVDASAIVSKEPTRSKSNDFKKPAIVLYCCCCVFILYLLHRNVYLAFQYTVRTQKTGKGVFGDAGLVDYQVGLFVGWLVGLFDCLIV
jgi:hypothetical protein